MWNFLHSLQIVLPLFKKRVFSLASCRARISVRSLGGTPARMTLTFCTWRWELQYIHRVWFFVFKTMLFMYRDYPLIVLCRILKRILRTSYLFFLRKRTRSRKHWIGKVFWVQDLLFFFVFWLQNLLFSEFSTTNSAHAFPPTHHLSIAKIQLQFCLRIWQHWEYQIA